MFVATVLQYAVQGPLLLALLAGVVMSAIFYRRQPQASAFAIAGFGLLMASTLVLTPVNIVLPRMFFEGGASARELARVLTAVGVFRSLLAAAAFALLIVAVFIGRRPHGDRRAV